MTLLAAHPSHMGPLHCYLCPDFLFIGWLDFLGNGVSASSTMPIGCRMQLVAGWFAFPVMVATSELQILIDEMDDNVKTNTMSQGGQL